MTKVHYTILASTKGPSAWGVHFYADKTTSSNIHIPVPTYILEQTVVDQTL